MALTTYEVAVDLAEPVLLSEELPEQLTAHLVGKGRTIGAINVRVHPEPMVVLDADADPTADFADFVMQPTKAELARGEMRDALTVIRAKADANRSPAERFILAFVRYQRLD